MSLIVLESDEKIWKVSVYEKLEFDERVIT